MQQRSRAFKLLYVVGLIASLALTRRDVHAQDEQSVRGTAKLNEVTWSTNGTYEWKRPDNVRYVIVRACGGGGGGGGGFSIFPRPAPRPDGGTAAGGGGGA